MKKVLLIHPWIEDFTAFDFWIKPLGLLTIGTLLRRGGLDVGLIDCVDRSLLNTPDERYGTGKIPSVVIRKPGALARIPRRFKRFGLEDECFVEHLRSFGRPDLVLTTCMMTYWYTGAFRAMRMIREIYPGVPIGLGGNYVTLCPDHAREHSGADFLFPDKDLKKILQRIQDVLGIANLPKEFSPPWPDYSFYPELRSVPLLTSRGCPYRCTYCAAPRLYPGFVQEDPETVILEIEMHAALHGVRDFAFFDDALLVHAGQHLHKILMGVIQRGLDLRFHLPNAIHAGSVTRETAELLYRSGFKTIRLGLESSDPTFQKSDSSDKVGNRRFLRGVRLLQEAGFSSSELGAYVLYGLPGQSDESVLETLGLVHEAGIRSYLSTFSPVPGTPCFEKAAGLDPGILNEPLLHNKHLCCYRSGTSYQRVKDTANRYNHDLDRIHQGA